jgi:hypothetical protein
VTNCLNKAGRLRCQICLSRDPEIASLEIAMKHLLAIVAFSRFPHCHQLHLRWPADQCRQAPSEWPRERLSWVASQIAAMPGFSP